MRDRSEDGCVSVLNEISEYALSIVLFIVVISVIIYFVKPKNAEKVPSYADKIMMEFNLDGGLSDDYYHGFEDGVEYAKDNPDEVVGGTAYEDELLDAGYETGYHDGYKQGYQDALNGE